MQPGCILLFFPAARANPFYHIIDGMGRESGGKFDRWGGDIFEAIDLPTSFAIEVGVHVVVRFMGMVAMAGFVSDYASSIFHGVYGPVFQKKGEHARDARLVKGVENFVKVHKGEGPVAPENFPQHQYPIRSRLDAGPLQSLFRFVHIAKLRLHSDIYKFNPFSNRYFMGGFLFEVQLIQKSY